MCCQLMFDNKRCEVHVLKDFGDMKLNSTCFALYDYVKDMQQTHPNRCGADESYGGSEMHCRLETHLFKHYMSFCSQ